MLLLLLLRAFLLLAPIAACFTLSSSLLASTLEDPAARVAAGAIASLVVPLLLRYRLSLFLRRRGRKPPPVLPTIALLDVAIAAGLAFGFADDAGRALRRHGDWFIGERNGAVARASRHLISSTAAYLEAFDPAPEVQMVAALPDPTPTPNPTPTPTRTSTWIHPLLGPERTLPHTASQRFGAARPQPRPAECELGHCGVDLFQPRGSTVLAVFDGVVEKLERDPIRGGRAGIYLVLSHGGGLVRSRYIHLDAIDDSIAPGTHLHAGQPLGRLGATGIFNSAPHLHFGLEIRGQYVDPEPYLQRWALAQTPPSA